MVRLGGCAAPERPTSCLTLFGFMRRCLGRVEARVPLSKEIAQLHRPDARSPPARRDVGFRETTLLRARERVRIVLMRQNGATAVSQRFAPAVSRIEAIPFDGAALDR